MFNLNLNSLFCFSVQNDGYIKIKTPFTYQDGSQINLFLKKEDQYFVVSDFGETIKDKNINLKQLENFCFLNSLEFDGSLLKRYINDTFENPSLALIDMIQSLIKISSSKDMFEQSYNKTLEYKYLNNYI